MLTVVPGRAAGPARAAVGALRARREDGRHPRDDRTAARAVARHSLYTSTAGRIVARRTWDGRTGARYERMLRAAEAAGNYEVAEEWEERGAALPRGPPPAAAWTCSHSPIDAAKGAPVGTGMGIGVAGRPRRRHGHQQQGRRATSSPR